MKGLFGQDIFGSMLSGLQSFVPPRNKPTTATFETVQGSLDSDFDSVSLYINVTGNDGDTTFTDSSKNAHTITNTGGGVTVSTDQAKFGTVSGKFGGGNTLTLPNDASFTMGTGDFTIDWWHYFPTGGTQGDGIFDLPLGTGTTVDGFVSASKMQMRVTNSFTRAGPDSGFFDSWHHYAIVRNSSTVYAFIDGTLVSTSASNSTDLTGDTIVIGAYYSASYTSDAGYFDRFRVTKGVGRFTTNFNTDDLLY